MDNVSKCKPYDWPKGLAWRMLEEMRKWDQPSELMSMLDLRVDLSKVSLKNDSKVLCSALNTMKNKYEDTGVSVDEAVLVGALISAATKVYFNSLNIQKG